MGERGHVSASCAKPCALYFDMATMLQYNDDEVPLNPMDSMTTSEREEAFWCRIVLMQHRMDKLEEENRNLKELVDLQREKLDMTAMFTPPKRERKKQDLPNRKTHTAMLHFKAPVDPERWNNRMCQLPECQKKVTHAQGKYCCHGHGLKHRWQAFKEQNEPAARTA